MHAGGPWEQGLCEAPGMMNDLMRVYEVLQNSKKLYVVPIDETWHLIKLKLHCLPDNFPGFRLYLLEILVEDCRTSRLLTHQWGNIHK